MKLPTCQELLDFLADYLADELPVETKSAFEQHLTLCPDCVSYLESYKVTLKSARTAFAEPMAPIPEELMQAILRSRGS